MSTETGLPARFAAWRVLHDVRHEVPFDVALGRAIYDLPESDRRLVHELAAGVFRNRSELDRALGSAVTRGIESVKPDTLDVLRLGAFQLFWLDRVPAHAAVQTTVDVAHRIGGEKVAGFVNAVLRRLTRAKPSATPDIPTPLAVKYSHPEWLVDRWLARFGAEETEQLLERNNQRPPLILQPARWDRARLEASLREQAIVFHEAPLGAGLVVEASKPTTIAGFDEGGFLVQDSAQRVIAEFMEPPEDGLLYDACASPGGKTVALATRVRRVVSADRTAPRIRKLLETVRRAAEGSVDVIQGDAARPPLRQADAVLLDVPCLGTGTFARNPDARWRVTEKALDSLVEQAARFLRAAAEIVAPNGLLLFATCSLESEENEAQVERFLTADPRFRREPSPRFAEFQTPAGDLMLLPHRTGTDGGFAARLRKAGP